MCLVWRITVRKLSGIWLLRIALMNYFVVYIKILTTSPIFLQVWDTLTTYKCLKTLEGHSGIVLALCTHEYVTLK